MGSQSKEEKLKEVQEALDEVRAKISSYEGGDRPMSPPVALLREERRLLELRDLYRKNDFIFRSLERLRP